jgi:hypothetical protein
MENIKRGFKIWLWLLIIGIPIVFLLTGGGTVTLYLSRQLGIDVFYAVLIILAIYTVISWWMLGWASKRVKD